MFDTPGVSCTWRRGETPTCLLPLCCSVFQKAPDPVKRRRFPPGWPRCYVLGCHPSTLCRLLRPQRSGWRRQSAASGSAALPAGWCHSPEAGARLFAGLKRCSSKSVRCSDRKAPTTDCRPFAWCKHLGEDPTRTRPSAGWRTYAPASWAQWFPPIPTWRENIWQFDSKGFYVLQIIIWLQ